MAETDGKANITTDSILNHMKSDEKNQHERQKVEELLPNRRVNNIELVVLRIYPRRLISTKNYTGPVAAACGRDETGIVGLVLWDSQIEQIRVGDIIRIEGGWCRQRDGELVVSTGKSGKIQILDR
jgi:ssDNA-binding replication factor A large subunit